MDDDVWRSTDISWEPLPVGVKRREGMMFVASFDDPVDELKVRRGKLTALVAGVWHIVPNPPS